MYFKGVNLGAVKKKHYINLTYNKVTLLPFNTASLGLPKRTNKMGNTEFTYCKSLILYVLFKGCYFRCILLINF